MLGCNGAGADGLGAVTGGGGLEGTVALLPQIFPMGVTSGRAALKSNFKKKEENTRRPG